MISMKTGFNKQRIQSIYDITTYKLPFSCKYRPSKILWKKLNTMSTSIDYLNRRFDANYCKERENVTFSTMVTYNLYRDGFP